MNIIINEEHRKGVSLYFRNNRHILLQFKSKETYSKYKYIFDITDKFNLFLINSYNMDSKKYTYFYDCFVLERYNDIFTENTNVGIIFNFDKNNIIEESDVTKIIRKDKLNKLNI